MRFTKRLALENCRDLWGWLAKTGKSSKRLWPEWERNGGTVPTMEADCPCCAYARARCRRCPLAGRWGRDRSGDRDCTSDNSPYSKWDLVKNKRAKRFIDRRKFFAAKIRDLAVRELKKLDEKNARKRAMRKKK